MTYKIILGEKIIIRKKESSEKNIVGGEGVPSLIPAWSAKTDWTNFNVAE
jgi:hypothetical protein